MTNLGSFASFFRLVLAGFATLAAIHVSVRAQQPAATSATSVWRTSGSVALSDDLARQGAVVSAGAQMFGSFDADSVSLRLVSLPVFGAAIETAPLVEFGPASVAFVREDGQGAIYLVTGTVSRLPVPVALDPQGRSVQAIELQLRYDRRSGTAEVTWEGQTYSSQAAAPSGPLPVVVSAGAEALWKIDALAVATTNSTEVSPPAGAKSGSGAAPLGAAARKAQIQANTRTAARLLVEGREAEADAVLASDNRSSPASAVWRQEMALDWTMIALRFARSGDKKGALRSARMALTHIALLVRTAGVESDLRADAYELEGFINAKLIGDATRAKGSYQRALMARPGSVRATEELARLAEAEARVGRN